MTTRTRAISKVITGGKTHKWKEKEYIVAIYMARFSPSNSPIDYKVGMYNIDQCAYFLGVRPKVLQIQVDNFKYFLGKNKLENKSPIMLEMFTKYKDYSQERLLDLAASHIHKLWKRTIKNLNVARYIQAIGQGCFVDYYELLEEASKNYGRKEKYIDKLPHKWNVDGRTMRVAYAAYIFWCKKEKEALTIVTESRSSRKETPENIIKAKARLELIQ